MILLKPKKMSRLRFCFISNNWQNFFIVSICLALSAFYELIEWWVALATGEDAEAFLGTQGYVWDTQSDMGLALLGAICSLLVLSVLHNKQLKNVTSQGIRTA